MKQLSHFAVVFIGLAVLLAACNKKTPEPITVTVKIEGDVDGEAIEFDQIKYTNQAGEKYSIEKCVFYLSNIQLVRNDDSVYGDKPKAHYFSLREGRLTTSLYNVPVGDYKAIRFIFGVAPELNTTGGLPNNPENINMAWPDMMGGGYHHMKLEGQYVANGDTGSYNTHLGDLLKDGKRYLIYFAVELPLSHTLNETTRTITLGMNINEWYRVPHTYSFAAFGPAIMNNPDALQTLRENGADVFYVKKVE